MFLVCTPLKVEATYPIEELTSPQAKAVENSIPLTCVGCVSIASTVIEVLY
jgi:hypothetical protein